MELIRKPMKIALPAIDRRRKWFAAALWYVAFCAIYTFTGNFHLLPPAVLAPWLPDRLIPSIDWTIWIYASQFLLLFGCFLGISSTRIISRMVYAISLASLLAFFVLLIYQSEFRRSLSVIDALGALSTW